MRPIPPPEIQNIQIPKVEKKHEASLFKITLILGIGALLVVWYGSLLQQATEKRRACSLRRTAEMSRPPQPTSLSAGHYSSSLPESRQAKERRKAGSLQSCLLLKELEKGLQPAFCMLLSSVDRSVCPWTYHGPHGGRRNERTGGHLW